MKNKNDSFHQSDVWTTIFNIFSEVVKMIFSVAIAIVIAGSKSSKPTNASAEDKTLHTGYRHNNDKTIHFDNDA
ncbi:hypothetical protein [Citrobacter farmeri]|uniref:hypothetical protein n=1 Tax=Citrobacter farmeri TaxID=67824 RepID=UPI00388F3D4B|nr:hypothetical protein [Citrobacter farmeri]